MTYAYERGRNDRRDGLNVEACPYKDGRDHAWRSGWSLQDALIRGDREYAYKRGRKDATDGNSVAPYPVGTTAYLQWLRGWTEVQAQNARKAVPPASKQKRAA